jgi:Zn-finger nucleic acid-binding protein
MLTQNRIAGTSNPSDDTHLPCPGCRNGLKGVYAEAHYGRYLLLDQCQACGGIWFDCWELYYLKEEEANSLDPVDREKLLTLSSFKKGPGLCPKCQVDLQPFRDSNLPEDARIERCPGCNGLWLNRGELRKYAGHKTALRNRRMDSRHQRPDISPHPTLEQNPKKLEALQKLVQALSTTVSPQIGGPSTLDEIEIDGAELTKDLVSVILQVLLRLILKI